MKRILLLSAILLAPWNALGQPPPDSAPVVVVDAIPIAAPAGVDAVPIAVLAQATPTPAAATPAPAATAEDPVDAVELLSGVGSVVDDWKNLGWLAGVIALINLLLNVLRFKLLNDWLTELDYKWLKPLIATLLGATLGGFSTFSTGAGILNSIVAGMLAGLGSVGFHELMDNLRKRTRKPAEG